MTMPTKAAERKKVPIYSGVLMYFPDMMRELAHCSWVGNEQHNKGEPLHWAREKSDDHLDCAIRHLMQADEIDSDGVPHIAKAAWRVLAYGQLLCERMEDEEFDRLAIEKQDRDRIRCEEGEDDDDDDGA